VNHSPAVRVLTVSLLGCLAAGSTGGPAGFLKADAVDVAALLPDPPVPGSPEARAEIDAVLAIQQSRTPADVARAKAEEKFDVFAFADAVGPWFAADRCPLTAALFKSVAADAKLFANVGKKHWDRRRPPYVDDRVKPVVTLEDEGSYPSSHSTRGQLYAELLSAVLPADRHDALMARGRQIGFDRLIGGVHFPSDVYAGRTLGHALAERLLADADFRARLDAVKAELAQQGKVATATP
jgi:acid phosphatase (class A)